MAKMTYADRGHVTKNIQDWIQEANDPNYERRVLKVLERMEGMEAPREAVGVYNWYVSVSNDIGTKYGWIVCRGNMIRTFLRHGRERYPANCVEFRFRRLKNDEGDTVGYQFEKA